MESVCCMFLNPHSNFGTISICDGFRFQFETKLNQVQRRMLCGAVQISSVIVILQDFQRTLDLDCLTYMKWSLLRRGGPLSGTALFVLDFDWLSYACWVRTMIKTSIFDFLRSESMLIINAILLAFEPQPLPPVWDLGAALWQQACIDLASVDCILTKRMHLHLFQAV